MMKYLIIGVLVFAVIAGFLFWKFGPSFSKKPEEKIPVVINVWGLWEDESLMKPALDEYKKIKPEVSVNYKFQSSQNYRTRTQTKINAMEGPDIYMINNAWTLMFLKSGSITPAPKEVFTPQEFSQTFYQVVRDDFTNYLEIKTAVDSASNIADKNKALQDEFNARGKIYAIPRGIDGLALFVNTDILSAAGIAVPKTWNEFRDAAFKLTVSDQSNIIKTAGASIGLTGNVDHWSDILGLLFLQQPGAKIDTPGDGSGADVLRFYIDFAKVSDKRVWDNTFEPSTQAFAAGKVAFYFAPSWRAHELRQINPQLNFRIAPVPQLAGKNVAWANYWGYTVSSKSKFPKESWEFLKFLTSAEAEKILYQKASETRLFGLPYSRVDLQKELLNDPLAGAFVAQGPYYKSWYLNSDTHDQGLNDEMVKYYEDAVNAAANNQDPVSSLQTTSKGIEQVLDKYIRPNPIASPSK
ncbi:extracellular solute-binding protein [Candidatus Daviesbacteria bacterium]|nr:extracellular solute-binding protein [Candidatus Daviesbacteria bacterium]